MIKWLKFLLLNSWDTISLIFVLSIINCCSDTDATPEGVRRKNLKVKISHLSKDPEYVDVKNRYDDWTDIWLNKDLCEHGDYYACYRTGYSLEGKIYTQPGEEHPAEDYFKKSRLLAKKRCDEGKAHPCYKLSQMWGVAEGGRQDFDKKKYYWQKAVNIADVKCSNGNSDDCLLLGVIWDNEHNSQNALEAYQRACYWGDPEGCEYARARKN